MVSIGLMVAALFLFILMYGKYVDGHVEQVLQKPIYLLLMFLPFIPCAIFNFMANGKEKKVKKLKAALKS